MKMKNMMGIIMVMVLTISLISSSGAAAATSNAPTFKVDGKLFVTPVGEPTPYINKDNRTMGSLRLLAAALGVESKHIKWDQAKNTATLTRGSNTVSVTVGKKAITVNRKSVTMDTVAEMKQNRVFIPARFIAQGLGVTISFDGSTNTVNFITGTTEVVNNNFADYGLKQVQELPISIAAGGLEVTYHDAFLYKANSIEGRALNQKYEFTRFDTANHLLFMKVTITNKSSKSITMNYSDLQIKMGAMNARGEELNFGFSEQDDYLYTWELEPNESITGHVAFLKYNDAPIDWIVLSTFHRDAVNSILIAEKVK